MASDKTMSDMDQGLTEVQSKELERNEESKTIDLSELVITFAPPNE